MAIDLVMANDTRYVLTDHLGSTNVIAHADGTKVEQQAFDAWGNRRSPDTWTQTGIDWPITTTTHGFTGQEGVEAMGIVHFGGRIYDPQLGRMLQADPVQNPGSQGLNRYAYVANNPLTLTDPTGYSWLSKLLHFDNNIVGRLVLGPLYDSYHSDWNSFVNNPYVRMVGAIVAAYFTGGAAYGAFIDAGYGTVAAGIAGGAAGGFVGGAIQSGGNMEAALQGALWGGVLGGLGGINANTPRQYDFSFSGAAKAVGRQLVTNWERDQIDRFFASEFGIKGLKLDLLLTGASFAGNAVFGSRYVGQVDTAGDGNATEFIGGIGTRYGLGYDPASNSNLWGHIANAFDVLLTERGLPSASGWEYVFSGDKNLPLAGYSLGASDVNVLAAYGLGSHVANYSVALPVGQVGAPMNSITLGMRDPVNGGIFGLLTSPGATMENRGFFDHAHSCYGQLASLGQSEAICAR
ncbi:MAG: RHS repeat-associated core domain-containing protein [Rudaea sp.]|uniref:RHS repeat domain-containing protein n=1 Tax=Rudaea sp. TaxID=2136325 RepID=UPI0039E3EA40